MSPTERSSQLRGRRNSLSYPLLSPTTPPVDALQDFDAHAEKPCRGPKANAILHHPSCRGVSQGMRRRPRLKPGHLYSALERGLHGLNGFAVEFDEMLLDDPARLPATHMRQ